MQFWSVTFKNNWEGGSRKGGNIRARKGENKKVAKKERLRI
jgi:hypothetical protein